MRRALMLLVGVMLLAPLILAQDPMVDVTATWTAPTEGNPVVMYMLQLSTDEGATWVEAALTEQLTVVLPLEVGVTYLARVAGRDYLDRWGPFSDPSEPYTPDKGPPGSCDPPGWSVSN